MSGPIYRVDYYDAEQGDWLAVTSRVTEAPVMFTTRKAALDAARHFTERAAHPEAERVRVTHGGRTLTEFEVRPDGTLRRLAS